MLQKIKGLKAVCLMIIKKIKFLEMKNAQQQAKSLNLAADL
jgi:hypothetical protein